MQYERLAKNRIYVLSAHSLMQKSADLSYPFQQEPYFYWLTRINEPGWVIVVDTFTDEKTLLSPKKDAVKELFDGSLADQDALKAAGADRVIGFNEREAFWQQLNEEHSEVYALGAHPHREYFHHVENPASAQLQQELSVYFNTVKDCRSELAALRAIKTADEINIMRRAIDVTIDGFERVKKIASDARYEYELEAEFSHAFRSTGANNHAYDPIVAGGQNACTLHYVENSAELPKNGLVLLDIGANVEGFAADITRTYALGTPTKRQIEVHGAVERAHHEIISLIKPGVSFSAYQESVDSIMKAALKNIGLLDDLSNTDTYRKYFPHAISHGLGLDVHESLGGFKEFMPGMVLTVEPGIYIPEEGIGVRIEDDILVTSTGNENLSKKLSTSL